MVMEVRIPPRHSARPSARHSDPLSPASRLPPIRPGTRFQLGSRPKVVSFDSDT